jgi:glycosyl hydrolase family 16
MANVYHRRHRAYGWLVWLAVAITPALMLAGDIPGWHQAFSEDFSTDAPVGGFPGTVYGSKWVSYSDGLRDTSGNGTYYPSKVLSVRNGVLNAFLHTENGIHMVAAPIPRLPGRVQHQRYGRYSVRFKADRVPGYKLAWLLWPDSNNWPADGEIDFPEGNLNGTIGAFVHYANPRGGQDEFTTTVPEAGAWHIATTEWAPGTVRFILDDQIIGTATTQVPSNPMHWVLQTETQLSGGPPIDSAAGNVQVDWVVISSRG